MIIGYLDPWGKWDNYSYKPYGWLSKLGSRFGYPKIGAV